MKCPSCNKENISGAKFCKYCGSQLLGSFKTCPNGHNYDSQLERCPYCPSNQEFQRTIIDKQSNARTVLDSANSDKTIMDSSLPTLKPTKSIPYSDKTVIFRPDGSQSGSDSTGSGQSRTQTRKLMGWLVTYDINPNGMDFRLYEGRNKIGKSSNSDIVLSQPGVSEDHALILYREGKFVIQDQLSTNGTFINEVSVEDKVTLKDSDKIKIGSVNLKIKVI